ncbi:hypothetical protein EV421DRAFT_1913143 [Armillaria borealis]|uniref:F-box domain-containing protein n=1 Tax=Armillaria borealis TaxID=47425 RepID=A0AA39IUZ3_9AGAR|nr:hypothetical protein EV421DRAFT_1913143 [Armillaria borealis]
MATGMDIHDSQYLDNHAWTSTNHEVVLRQMPEDCADEVDDSMHLAGLSDLPNEMVMAILDDIKPEDLLSIAQLGRCLNEEFKEFCALLHILDCQSLKCSQYVQWFDQLILLPPTFSPPPITTLHSIQLPGLSSRLLDWLIVSMNASPIHSVVIELLSEEMLKHLHLPMLRNMTCIDHDLCLVPLGIFMTRHHNMERLSMVGHTTFTDDHILLQAILQPMQSLTYLSANLNVLSAFFSCRGCFPALAEVGVHGPLTGMSGWFYIPHTNLHIDYIRDIFQLLGAVLGLISTIKTVTSLKLPFLSHFEGNAWNMCIFGKDDIEADTMVPLPQASQQPESLLTNIHTLTLFSAEGHPVRRDTSFDVARAVGYFPLVQCLVLQDELFLSDMGWTGNKDALLDKLTTACSSLQVVKLGEVEHRVRVVETGDGPAEQTEAKEV